MSSSKRRYEAPTLAGTLNLKKNSDTAKKKLCDKASTLQNDLQIMVPKSTNRGSRPLNLSTVEASSPQTAERRRLTAPASRDRLGQFHSDQAGATMRLPFDYSNGLYKASRWSYLG